MDDMYETFAKFKSFFTELREIYKIKDTKLNSQTQFINNNIPDEWFNNLSDRIIIHIPGVYKQSGVNNTVITFNDINQFIKGVKGEILYNITYRPKGEKENIEFKRDTRKATRKVTVESNPEILNTLYDKTKTPEMYESDLQEFMNWFNEGETIKYYGVPQYDAKDVCHVISHTNVICSYLHKLKTMDPTVVSLESKFKTSYLNSFVTHQNISDLLKIQDGIVLDKTVSVNFEKINEKDLVSLCSTKRKSEMEFLREVDYLQKSTQQTKELLNRRRSQENTIPKPTKPKKYTDRESDLVKDYDSKEKEQQIERDEKIARDAFEPRTSKRNTEDIMLENKRYNSASKKIQDIVRKRILTKKNKPSPTREYRDYIEDEGIPIRQITPPVMGHNDPKYAKDREERDRRTSKRGESKIPKNKDDEEVPDYYNGRTKLSEYAEVIEGGRTRKRKSKNARRPRRTSKKQ